MPSVTYVDPGVVIAGAGQGGFQAAASLRKQGYTGPIRLVGEEPGLPYQRPPLSKDFLTSGAAPESVRLRPQAFYAKQGIEVMAGERVTRIDRDRHEVELASGGRLAYEHLVLALGSRARTLPVEGGDLEGVFCLRTVGDAETLRSELSLACHVVVVGGGFIGLEFAAAARASGADVTVVEALERAMARVVSPDISRFFAARHEAAGTTVLLGSGVTALEAGTGRSSLSGEPDRGASSREAARGRVAAVRLADGRRLPADLVVVGIGVVPTTDLAERAGLTVRDGIVVDETLATEDSAISAIGDCAAYPSRHAGARVRLESVQNAVDHGRCVAARIAGVGDAYAAVPWFWSDQHGYKLQIAGLTSAREHAVVRGDVDAGRFSVFCFRGGSLVGVESVNAPADHIAARRLLAGEPALTPEQAAEPGLDLKALA